MSIPQVVEKRLIYMTPEWKDAFFFTAKLADSLGLEMAIAGSPGWSESGSPWVTPAGAMKKFVWSEIRVEGGKSFDGTLPKPPTATGTFQNIEDRKGERSAPLPEYYADAAEVAFRIPENDIPIANLRPKITSSGGKFDLTALSDCDLAKTTFLPTAPPNEKSWIQFEFTKPETIQSVTMVARDRRGKKSRTLETSDDGLQFKTILEITDGDAAQSTITFPPAIARFFRVTFTTPAAQSSTPGSGNQKNSGSVEPEGIQIAELDLHTVARVNRFEDKSGFSSCKGLYSLATPSIPSIDAISRKEVIDLNGFKKIIGTDPVSIWAIFQYFRGKITFAQK